MRNRPAGSPLMRRAGWLGSAPGAALPDDDCGVDLLSEFLDYLLDGAQNDIADGSGRQPVETASDALHCDDEEVLGAGVISAVEGGSDGEAAGDSELDTDCTCFGLFGHRLIYYLIN